MDTTTARRLRLTAVVMVVLGLGLAGCTSTTGTASSAATATATATTATTRHTPTSTGTIATPTFEPEREVTVTGRHFRARCAGSGPSVVMVADYAQAMDDAWGTVPQVLAASSRVCVYDRLGVGRSDSPPARQTFAALATDLDGVISALGLTRPVVVMGHGLGAPIAVSWASRHEADARAVMLLDPDPPGYLGPDGAFEKLLPPKDVGDPELASLWAEIARYDTPATNKESLDPTSWAAYSRLAPLSTPLYDLVRAQAQTPSWPAAVDARKVDATWRAYQRRVLSLSTPSEMVTVPTPDDWPRAIRTTLERALQS